MLKPRCLTALWVSTACYRDSVFLRSYGMSVKFYHTVQRHIWEDSTVHSHLYENLRMQQFVFFISWCEVRLTWVHLVRRPPLFSLLCWMMDYDECEAFGGMIIGRGNRSTLRKPAPMPLLPPQIPHRLIWDRTQAAAVGNRRLTIWPMARR
jgi:hypothetical protein